MIFVADVSSIFVIQNIDAEETTPAANLEILTLLVVLLWTNHTLKAAWLQRYFLLLLLGRDQMPHNMQDSLQLPLRTQCRGHCVAAYSLERSLAP